MANNVPDDMECPQCHGTGERGGETCSGCGGSGRVPVEHLPPDADPYRR